MEPPKIYISPRQVIEQLRWTSVSGPNINIKSVIGFSTLPAAFVIIGIFSDSLVLRIRIEVQGKTGVVVAVIVVVVVTAVVGIGVVTEHVYSGHGQPFGQSF